MAEEKKGAKVYGNAEMIEILIILFIVGSVLNRIIAFFSGESEVKTFFQQKVLSFFSTLGGFLHFFSVLLVLLLLTAIVYVVIRINQLQHASHHEEKMKSSMSSVAPAPLINTRWKQVIDHVTSINPNDWKLAVLEADIILSEMLDMLGYMGDGIGEKLKRIERSDFDTLDFAWEAHKIRNEIAHQGSSFTLSQHEANRVISLYQKVFNEFHYI